MYFTSLLKRLPSFDVLSNPLVSFRLRRDQRNGLVSQLGRQTYDPVQIAYDPIAGTDGGVLLV